jgi:hypothetical protein
MINWKEEAEQINLYSDYEIEPNEESVLDYLEFITSINGSDELYSNEKELLLKLEVEQ